MTIITVTIFQDAEAFIEQHFNDLPFDRITPVYPVEELNVGGTTKFVDREENTSKHLSMADFTRALKLLAEKIGISLFVGGITSPSELTNINNWDVEVADAFFQLAYHGEVIYG